jgi:carbon-monoxide dehydrogenase medium subunit
MKAAATSYRRAASLEQATELCMTAEGMPKYLAGGQSLLPMMNLRLALADAVIDISGIPALRETRHESGSFFIGAGVTHAMIEDGKVEDVARGYLRHVARGIAYRSVRNRGTLGGSLAHADPAADWPSALLALDAVAVIRGESGPREMPLRDFQVGLMETGLGEYEILLGVRLPVLSPAARWSYLKFCRKVGEFAHSIGAAVIDPEHGIANVVLGAAADKPALLPGVSARLAQGADAAVAGSPAFARLLEQDLEQALRHAPSSYDFHLHKTMVTRAILEALKK